MRSRRQCQPFLRQTSSEARRCGNPRWRATEVVRCELGTTGYRRIADVTERILAALEAAPGGELRYGDASIPEEIRDAFGVSKKAFKQAIGALYRDRRITIEPTRIRLVREEEKR